MSSEQPEEKRKKTQKFVGNTNTQERQATLMEDTSTMPNSLGEVQSNTTLRHKSAHRNRHESSMPEKDLQNGAMNENVVRGSQRNYNVRRRYTGNNNNSGFRVNGYPLQRSFMHANIFQEMMRHPLVRQQRTSLMERNERPATSSMISSVVEGDQQPQNVEQQNISETRRPVTVTSLASCSVNAAAVIVEENKQSQFLGRKREHREHPLPSSSANRRNGNLEIISPEILEMPRKEEEIVNQGVMHLEELAVSFAQLRISKHIRNHP